MKSLRDIQRDVKKAYDQYVAHLPICAKCSENLVLRKTESPNEPNGKCLKCGTEYIVREEVRYHIRKV